MGLSEILRLKERYKLNLLIKSAIPNNLFTFLTAQTNNDLKEYHSHYIKDKNDWIHLEFPILWMAINKAEQSGMISTGKVLDLGAGNGSSSMIWAYKGYDTIGIELDGLLVNMARKNYDKFTTTFDKPQPKILHGNYFPKEHTKPIVADLKSDLVNETITYSHNKLHLNDNGSDVYTSNNISLKDFDIIYGYLWTSQMPDTIDMFKKHARNDALLIVFGPYIEDICKDMGLKEVEKAWNLYYK